MKQIGDFCSVFIIGFIVIGLIQLLMESPVMFLIILIGLGVVASVVQNLSEGNHHD